MRRFVIAAVMAWPLSLSASADLERSGMPDPVQLGEATIRWLGAPIYDASLYTTGGGAFRWQAPMALQLAYRRGFSGAQLLDATMQEIRRIEGDRADHAKLGRDLEACYRDVGRGDAITAVSKGANDLSLWMNGSRLCALDMPNIQQRFLGIWLSPQSRIARLGLRLRGQ